MAFQALARQGDPIVAILAVGDAETDEQGLFAVALQGKAGGVAQLLAHQRFDAPQEGALGQRCQLVVGFRRIDVDAFPIGQLRQQLEAGFGTGRDQRGAGEIDDADDHLAKLACSRFPFVAGEDVKPGQHRERHQYRDQ